MIVFCSLIESSIGIMASSLPSLRRVVRRIKHADASGDSAEYRANTDDIITFGAGGSSKEGRGARGGFCNPTDAGISLTTVQGRSYKDNWTRLHDSDSDRGQGIKAQYTYAVEVEEDSDGRRSTERRRQSRH